MAEAVWSMGRSVIVALVVGVASAIAVQTIAAITWAVVMDYRMATVEETLKRSLSALDVVAERSVKNEATVQGAIAFRTETTRTLEKIEQKIDDIIKGKFDRTPK